MQSLFENIPPNVEVLVYADDITLISFNSFKSTARKCLQAAVNQVGLWADKVGFTISPEKSQLLHVSPNRRKMSKLPELTLNNQVIVAGKSLRVLGVYLDRTLSFRHHISSIRTSVNQRLRVIQSIASRVPCAHRTSTQQIVNAWLLPKLFYGAGLFSRGTGLESQLRPLYNRIIRTANGVFVTSPTLAVMAEAGQLPFEHQLASCVMTKAARWLSLNGRNDVPLVRRANQLLNSITTLHLPPIASLPRTKNRLWNIPSPSIDLSLLRVVKAKDPPDICKQHYLTLVDRKYKHHHHIFTDGSLVNGNVGYGVFSKDTNNDIDIQIKSALPTACTIFSAEAYALMKASNLPPHPNKPTVIFSDSASCLEELKSPSTTNPWLLTTELTSLSKNVSFCWVPGHKGIQGNVNADKLAETGRYCDVEEVSVPSKDAVKWSKKHIRESWNSEWFNSREFALRRVKPITSPWPDNPNPKHRRVLSRLRIGHTRLTHSYRLDKTPPPSCTTCGVPLTIPHILTDCTSYRDELTANNLDIALELILSPPYEANLIKFLEDTGLYGQI